LIVLTDFLQIRERTDGGGIVQREQHVGKHDQPAFGSLLAGSRFARLLTYQHTWICRGNAGLAIRRFVRNSVSLDLQTSTAHSAREDPVTERILCNFSTTLLPFFYLFLKCDSRSSPLTIDCLRDLDRYSAWSSYQMWLSKWREWKFYKLQMLNSQYHSIYSIQKYDFFELFIFFNFQFS